MKSLREQVAELVGYTQDPRTGPDVWHLKGKGFTTSIPPYDTSSDAILAVIRRRFVTEKEKDKFNAALDHLVNQKPMPSFVQQRFNAATATPEQLCRATIAAAGKEQP